MDSRPGFLKFVAYLQIIGIILVVLGHSCHMYPDGNHGHSTLLYRMLFSFRMPLFMFTSGFLLILTTSL
ncbi:MAG: acyltransferase family protein, partial [Muribaculaceae bacterium]|nr:acyltransferase family protein [Muribaculaceae bacterium]